MIERCHSDQELKLQIVTARDELKKAIFAKLNTEKGQKVIDEMQRRL